jgi:hypothetical protein
LVHLRNDRCPADLTRGQILRHHLWNLSKQLTGAGVDLDCDSELLAGEFWSSPVAWEADTRRRARHPAGNVISTRPGCSSNPRSRRLNTLQGTRRVRTANLYTISTIFLQLCYVNPCHRAHRALARAAANAARSRRTTTIVHGDCYDPRSSSTQGVVEKSTGEKALPRNLQLIRSEF